jgi:uncharacterized cofD-like protein
MKKNTVVFGGGNGSAITLQALKINKEQYTISAVIAMSDSGGSSGKLRKEFNTLPAGDIMRAVLSLSSHEYKGLLQKIFYKKRGKDVGKLSDHSLGNLFLILAEQYAGNFMDGVRALEQALDTTGVVYPATLEPCDLVAELTDGTLINSEVSIGEPTYDRSLVIKRIWLEPAVVADEDAIESIKNAEYIILGPGSLFTSVIASILPKGIKQAIHESKATLIYIAGNKYDTQGETGPTNLSGCVFELEKYLPRKVDVVVFNGSVLTKEQQEHYALKGWGVLEYTPEKLSEYRVYDEEFESEWGGLCPGKLSKILRTII